jgi:hypothetical protein
MESRSTFWLPDITDWWLIYNELHPKYTDLSNLACNIFSIIPHGIRDKVSYSLGLDFIRWKQSEATGGTDHDQVLVRQFASVMNGLLSGDDHDFDPTSAENVM